MNRFRWQIGLLVLAMALVAILLIGQQPLLGSFSSEPSSGGLYVEGLVGSLGRLNPLLDFANNVDQDVNALLFSGLLRFDDRGNPQADLAEEWALSLDGLTYNLRLKEDALWHDGVAFTSADVIFTTNLLAHPDTPIPSDLREFWRSIEVIAFDDYNIQFRLQEPFAPFLDYLAVGLLPEHLLGNTHPSDLAVSPFNSNPIGTGPYSLGEIIIEENEIAGVVLNASANYYLDGPFIDQIIFRYFAESTTAYQAYLDGEILGMGYVDKDVLGDVLVYPGLNSFSSRLPQLAVVLINLDRSTVPFFQESEVRKALLNGINRQYLVDEFLAGQAFVANGPILPGSWAYSETNTYYSFDLDLANQRLRDAGFSIPSEGGGTRAKDGIFLSFELLHPNTPEHTAMAEEIRDTWARLGVAVQLNGVDYETLLSDYLEPRNYEAALVDLNMSNLPDPDPYPFWHEAEANSGQNYSRWTDRRASVYLEQARVSISQSQRERLYRNFQIHFSREIPALPLFFPVYNYAISVQVQGVNIGPLYSPSDRFYNVNEWFLVAQGASGQNSSNIEAE
jgi:peptide/nickel transport system substrate-binding protein